METPNAPVNSGSNQNVSPNPIQDKTTKWSILIGGGLLVVGIFSYFLAGGGLFKGQLELKDLTALQTCVDGINQNGLMENNVYTLTIKDGCELQMASNDETKAKVYYNKITKAEAGGADSMTYTFAGENNIDDKNVNVYWSFGDDTPTEPFEAGKDKPHTFTNEGKYTVKIYGAVNVGDTTLKLIAQKDIEVKKVVAAVANAKVTVALSADKNPTTIDPSSGGQINLMKFQLTSSNKDTVVSALHFLVTATAPAQIGDLKEIRLEDDIGTIMVIPVKSDGTAQTDNSFKYQLIQASTKQLTANAVFNKLTPGGKYKIALVGVEFFDPKPEFNPATLSNIFVEKSVAAEAATNAEFSYTIKDDSAGRNVTFTDKSQGDIAAWSWDFGDGSAKETYDAKKDSVTHTYKYPELNKTYIPTLIITDKSSKDFTYKDPQGVEVKRPVSFTSFGCDQITGKLAAQCSLKGFALSYGDKIKNAYLNYSDSGLDASKNVSITNLLSQNGDVTIPEYDFSAAGKYKVWLYLLDDYNTTLASGYFVVADIKELAFQAAPMNSQFQLNTQSQYQAASLDTKTTLTTQKLQANYGITEQIGTKDGLKVSFGDSSSPSDTIKTWSWDFGDNKDPQSYDSTNGKPPATITHTYQYPTLITPEFSYNPKLTVSDGATSPAFSLNLVISHPVSFDINCLQRLGTLNVTCKLDPLEVNYGDNITNMAIDFGDGLDNSKQNIVPVANKITEAPNHTYAKEGQYNVSVILTDDFSQNLSKTLNFTVTPIKSANAYLFADVFESSPNLSVMKNPVTLHSGDAVGIVTYKLAADTDAKDITKIRFNNQQWSLDIHKLNAAAPQPPQGDQGDNQNICKDDDPIKDIQSMATTLVEKGSINEYFANDPDFQKLINLVNSMPDAISNVKNLIAHAQESLDKYKDTITSDKFSESLHYIGISPLTSDDLEKVKDLLTQTQNSVDTYAKQISNATSSDVVTKGLNSRFLSAIYLNQDALSNPACRDPLKALSLKKNPNDANSLLIDLTNVPQDCLANKIPAETKVNIKQTQNCFTITDNINFSAPQNNGATDLVNQVKPATKVLTDLLGSVNAHFDTFKDTNSCEFAAKTLQFAKTTLSANFKNSNLIPIYTQTIDAVAGQEVEIPKLYSANADVTNATQYVKPAHGSVSETDGKLMFKADADFNGVDGTSYRLEVKPDTKYYLGNNDILSAIMKDINNPLDANGIAIPSPEGLMLTCINVKSVQAEAPANDGGGGGGGGSSGGSGSGGSSSGGGSSGGGSSVVSRFTQKPEIKTGVITAQTISDKTCNKVVPDGFKLIDTTNKAAILMSSLASGKTELIRIIEGFVNDLGEREFRGSDLTTRSQFLKVAEKAVCLFQGDEETFSIPSFVDVLPDKHWAFNYIEFAKEKGIIKGYDDGTFKPDQNITKAEAIAILNRINKTPTAPSTCAMPFTDVPLTHWAYKDAHDAACAGITMGDGEGNLNPDRSMTRDEMVNMIYNYFVSNYSNQ